MKNIIGIFTSPRETLERTNEKPSWLIPFIISVIFAVAFQFLLMDIQAKDQIATFEARDISAQQMEAMRNNVEGPARYFGLIAIPIVVLIMWSILSGIYLLVGNTIMGGESKFKNLFSMFAWTGLIGIAAGLVRTLLVLARGTSHGVTTSLAILLPTPAVGAAKPALYRLFSQFEIFTIWGLILWIIGVSVIYKFTMKKSATLVLSLWVIWLVISVALGGVLGQFGM